MTLRAIGAYRLGDIEKRPQRNAACAKMKSLRTEDAGFPPSVLSVHYQTAFGSCLRKYESK
jgi:hypothetical protein